MINWKRDNFEDLVREREKGTSYHLTDSIRRTIGAKTKINTVVLGTQNVCQVWRIENGSLWQHSFEGIERGRGSVEKWSARSKAENCNSAC